MVVVHHAADSGSGIIVQQLDWGQAGVAVFFCISGFIIWTSSRTEAADEFAVKRLVRIVPLYWLALASVIAIGIHSWHKPIFAPLAIVKSLLFIPYFAEGSTPTPFPVLVPGWTLNFEMFFYAVFALGIFVRRPLSVPIAVMTVLFVAGQLFAFRAAPLVLYTKWLSILFVAGLIIGAADPRWTWVRWLWPVGVLLVFAYQLLPSPLLMLAFGATMLIAGVIAQERAAGWPAVRPLQRLGDASYAIYLFHMPTLFLLGSVMRKAPSGAVPAPLYIGLCVTLSWTVGLIIHRYVERPLAKKLRDLTKRPKTASSELRV